MHSFEQQNLKCQIALNNDLTEQNLKGKGSSFNQENTTYWHFGFALESKAVASPSGEAAVTTPY